MRLSVSMTGRGWTFWIDFVGRMGMGGVVTFARGTPRAAYERKRPEIFIRMPGKGFNENFFN